MKVALTIAGSDSGGGAGIQADLRTFAAFGVHGACALAAVTAQSSVEVADFVALSPAFVVRQIETVAEDMAVAAAKTGMLANAAIVEAVAGCVRRLGLPFLVVDPVMVATSGGVLLDEAASRACVSRLFPIATVVTPNVPEAEALLGSPIRGVADLRRAARALVALGARAVVVKGGHLEGDLARDVFFDGETLIELEAPRLATRHTHGTGCTFSAAIAAGLALGAPLAGAVREAKRFVTAAIAGGYAVGRGPGSLDHFHSFRRTP